MKKRIFALLVAIMVLSMGTLTVSAAVSPTAEDVISLVNAAKSDDGYVVMLPIGTVSSALDFLDELTESFVNTITLGTPQGAPGLNDIVAGLAPEAGSDDKVEIVPEIIAAFEFVPSTDTIEALAKNGVVEVEFACDVKAGDDVVILHYNEVEWEVIVPTEVLNGKVIAPFTGFSPIAIVSLDNKAVGSTSPKTGEIVTLLGSAAIFCFAGVCFCGRKAKENK